ncbi:reticulon-like protein B22 [Nicotiana tabacum]|uniref:Reticulon-like protein B22 n=2 Tax=Nicotiana TaxID=4085 RepID=A0A1S4CEX2_TOBAC|nr:PREDICTED: reticulon-like protein B22 [Nicotiana sylvestris]XP_016499509.1 PREDICTED: reticulon-like protein B22 [Nicotiana tabacum]
MEMELNANEEISTERNENPRKKKEVAAPVPFILIICGSLVYYHCAYRNSSIVSLVSDVFIVFLCSLAILGLLFRQMNISVPVDPIEWQISQDTANCVFACLANTIGAAESVLRVAATGHDKRLFLKVVVILYVLSVLGRIASGVTIAYAGLCFLCVYMLAKKSQLISACLSSQPRRRECTNTAQGD